MATAVADPVRARILAEISERPISPSQFAGQVGGEISAVGRGFRQLVEVGKAVDRGTFDQELDRHLSHDEILLDRIGWAELADRHNELQFVEEVGGEASYIARCFRELAEWDLIELVEERRGGRHGGGRERIYRSVQRMFFDDETWTKLPLFLRVEVSTSILRDFVRRIDETVEAGTFDADPEPWFAWKTVVLARAGWRALSRRLDSTLFWAPQVGRESIARTAGNADELVPAIVGMAAFRTAMPTLGAGSLDAAH